jgi:hypothetical protein
MICRNFKLLVAQDFVLLKYQTDKMSLGINWAKCPNFGCFISET